MTSDHVFGSDELSPDLLRGATFAEQDGWVSAAEVRTFLDRVASSLEVFMSQDAPTALRAEFARNAEIAQQVLDAGQNAAEQLRRQAAEDARSILDETREATDRLRATMEGEIAQSREQVETMRAQFIQDLRDLYDRIGASLYRFERAADEAQHAPIQEPARQERGSELQEEPADRGAAAVTSEPPAAAQSPVVAQPREQDQPVSAQPQQPSAATQELPEGAKPPAWQQLPPEAWAATPATGGAGPAPAVEAAPPHAREQEAAGPDAFAVQEDEPLAPGEPLVDLRDFGAAQQSTAPAVADTEPAGASAGSEGHGGSWLDAEDAAGTTSPPSADAPGPSEAIEATPPSADLGGSWLVDTPADIAGADRDPGLAHDDALAEALIAGTTLPEDEQGEQALDTAAQAGSAPAGGSTLGGASHTVAEPADAPAVAASPDAVAVRQLILDSLAAGQSRETIEAYLRNQMGFVEPGALVDAAIGSAGQPG